MKKFSLFAILLGFNIALGACSDDDAAPVVKNEIFQLPEKAYVLAEQSRRAIVIRDAETHRNIWSWDPYTACVPAAQQGWFVNPSEVKPVFNRRYILMTASGGAVALIRLSDHKLMFYANCGQNPHSAEVLPDGNIVTAESKSGEINTFVVDTVKVLGAKANTVKLGNAHNVVWDKKRSYLYATATKKEGVTALFRFKYDGNRSNPKLINQTTLYTFSNESGGHDLFPVYGEEDKLWLTAASAVYKFDLTGVTDATTNDFDGSLRLFTGQGCRSLSRESEYAQILDQPEVLQGRDQCVCRRNPNGASLGLVSGTCTGRKGTTRGG